MIAGGSWSWIKKPRYISTRRAVHMLLDIVSKGGKPALEYCPFATWENLMMVLMNY